MMPRIKTRADFPTTLKYKYYILSTTFPEQFKTSPKKLQQYGKKINRQMNFDDIDIHNSTESMIGAGISQIKPISKYQGNCNESQVRDFSLLLHQQFGYDRGFEKKENVFQPVAQEKSEKSNSVSEPHSDKFINELEKSKMSQDHPKSPVRIKHTQSQPLSSPNSEKLLSLLQENKPVAPKINLMQDSEDENKDEQKIRRLREKAQKSLMGGSGKNPSMISKDSPDNSRRQQQLYSPSKSIARSFSKQQSPVQKTPLLRQLRSQQQFDRSSKMMEKVQRNLVQMQVGQSMKGKQKQNILIIPEQNLQKQPIILQANINRMKPSSESPLNKSTPDGSNSRQMEQNGLRDLNNEEIEQASIKAAIQQINAQQQQHQDENQQPNNEQEQSTRNNQDDTAKLSSVRSSNLEVKPKQKIDLNESSDQQKQPKQQQNEQEGNFQDQFAIDEISIDEDSKSDKKKQQSSSQEDVMNNKLVLKFLEQYRDEHGCDWIVKPGQQQPISSPQKIQQKQEQEHQQKQEKMESVQKSEHQQLPIEKANEKAEYADTQVQTESIPQKQRTQTQVQTQEQQPSIPAISLQQTLQQFSILEQTITTIASKLTQSLSVINLLTSHISSQDQKIQMLQKQSKQNKQSSNVISDQVKQIQNSQQLIKQNVDNHNKQLTYLNQQIQQIKTNQTIHANTIQTRITQSEKQLSQQIHRLGESMFESQAKNSTKTKM